MKTRVSGVPYEVDMPETKHTLSGLLDDIESYIAELEHENRLLKSRIDSLENELRIADAQVSRLTINLHNERNNKQ
jgi:cell division septum initiation protein DivIVA